MKYNPRVNEDVTSLPGFAAIHPYQPEETVQALELMYNPKRALGSGMGLMPQHCNPGCSWRVDGSNGH